MVGAGSFTRGRTVERLAAPIPLQKPKRELFPRYKLGQVTLSLLCSAAPTYAITQSISATTAASVLTFLSTWMQIKTKNIAITSLAIGAAATLVTKDIQIREAKNLPPRTYVTEAQKTWKTFDEKSSAFVRKLIKK